MGLKFIRRVKIEGTDLGALPKGGKGTVVRGFTGPKNMLKNPGFLMAEPLDADRLKIRLVKNSFYEFVKEFWSTVVAERPVWNWHIKYLCDQAQAVMERVMREEPKEYDLVTNVPPGTSKSTIFSIMLPAWAWARKPSLRFICCSYDSNLAWNLSRKCRKVIKSEKYQRWFPEVSLVSDQDTKTLFANSEGGERYAVGSGGGIIGNHAHCIIIDDPLDPKRAASDVELEAVNNWIKEELSGRKVDKRVTATMVIMQRLHQTDPSAVMVKSGGVRHIKLPATTEGEVLPAELEVNYKDGLLDPIRMPLSVLDEIKAGPRGQFVYSGQYLQCLAGDTLIMTDKGEVRIEDVKVGDSVFTREGFKSVLWSGITGSAKETVSVLFSNGSELRGTPNHPIWTVNRGWVPLYSIRGRDIMYSGDLNRRSRQWDEKDLKRPNLSSSTERPTFGDSEKRTSGVRSRGENDYTGPCGDSTMGIYPVAITYTTVTKTRLTTRLKIWSAFPIKTTERLTPRNDEIRKVCDFWTRSVLWASPGINRKKVVSFTRSMVVGYLPSSGRKPNTRNTSVSPVRRNSSLVLTSSPCTVPGSVRNGVGSDVTPRSVSTVKKTSSQRTTEFSVAGSLVRPSGGDVGVSVFDLTVKDVPEFFANGVLVHNSPVPPGGGMFQTFKFMVDKPPPLAKFKRLVRYWDKAATQSGGAYTVGLLMGTDPDDVFWVLDVVRVQFDSNRREKLILSTAQRDGRGVWVGLEQEPGSGGKESTENTVRNLAGFIVRYNKPTGDKELRADPYSVQVNAGNVRLAPGKWNDDYIEELRYFPFSTYKDQVDASSGAFGLLYKKKIRLGGLE